MGIMKEYDSLSHTKWECKYHVVFIPKYRRKVLYHELRRHVGSLFRTLAEQKECRIEEGHVMPDHVHMLIAIPPKYSVAQVIGYIKARARSTSRERFWRSRGTSWGRVSGLGATSSRP